jgi:hypothetical protein
MNPMKKSGRDTQQPRILTIVDARFEQTNVRGKTRCVYNLIFLAYFQLPTALQYKGQSEYNIKMQIHNVFSALYSPL